MAITAALVKELRERTGSGMMECKKALVETDGDIDAAVEALRKSGAAKADKKAGRTAAEGRIVIEKSSDGKQLVMLEVNSETDFAASDDNFVNFSTAVAKRIIDSKPGNLQELNGLTVSENDSATIEDARKALIAKIGENITIRQFGLVNVGDNNIGVSYLHGVRIGVLVELEGGSAELAKDIAMHVAATNPECVSEADVSQDLIEKEKEIFSAQAAESGKPPEIIEKMVGGRIKKYLREITLLGQPFVKDPDTLVEKLLANANAKVIRFQRFEVGEGIEKKAENFAEEVMAQVQGK